jgi:ribosomal silencing factor RsfS
MTLTGCASTVLRNNSSSCSIEAVVEILRKANTIDVCVVGTPPHINYADYLVSTSTTSKRHLRAAAESLAQQFKHKLWDEAFLTGKHLPEVQGLGSDDWIAVDLGIFIYLIFPKFCTIHCLILGRVVVHLLTREKREELELEKLWTLGPEYDDQFQIAVKQ